MRIARHRPINCSGKRFARSLAGFVCAAAVFGHADAAQARTASAVEYDYAAWDNDFVTAFPDEIAVLDGGAFGGNWKRTGETFVVAAQPGGGANEACRYTGTFKPRPSVNAFDGSVQSNGFPCIYGAGPVTGVMYFNAVNHKWYGIAPPSDRLEIDHMIATKDGS